MRKSCFADVVTVYFRRSDSAVLSESKSQPQKSYRESLKVRMSDGSGSFGRDGKGMFQLGLPWEHDFHTALLHHRGTPEIGLCPSKVMLG